jgi:hypothetical protein
MSADLKVEMSADSCRDNSFSTILAREGSKIMAPPNHYLATIGHHVPKSSEYDQLYQ